MFFRKSAKEKRLQFRDDFYSRSGYNKSIPPAAQAAGAAGMGGADAAGAGAQDAGAQAGPADDNVVDADYTVVDDDK